MTPVLPDPALGGGHKRTFRLCEAIERAGVVPHVATTEPSEPEAAAALRERGWPVEVLPGPLPAAQRLLERAGRLPSPRYPAMAHHVRALARGMAFVQLETILSTRYLADLDGVPAVLSLHNIDSDLLRTIARTSRPPRPAWLKATNRWQATRSVERWGVPRAHTVICCSERDAAHFEASHDEVLLVTNGADDAFFAVPPAPADTDVVLFFGQLDWEPNDHGIRRFLAEAWPRIAEARPRARLRVVGRRAGRRLTAAAAAAPATELVGWVPDIADELAGARVVVAPLWHGGGTRIKVVESMAAGRPVVGTSLGVEGIGFEPDEHGHVADDARGLAAGTVALLDEPGRAARLGAAARVHAEAYRWSRCTVPMSELAGRLAAAA